MKVLVIGATGALGCPVVKALLERGVPVRAVNRHPEQAADLARLGAEVVAGDLPIPRHCSASVPACSACSPPRTASWAAGAGAAKPWTTSVTARSSMRHEPRACSAWSTSPATAHGWTTLSTSSAPSTASSSWYGPAGSIPSSFAPRPSWSTMCTSSTARRCWPRARPQLIGAGKKKRNFVAASDVAQFAVRALLEEPPRFSVLDIGGPDHLSNAEVAELYAREAGIEPRIGRMPAGVARAISFFAAPVHPGLARIMRLMSLPDDAFSERFEGAAALERDYGAKLTSVREFVAHQVRLARLEPPG